jgi:hypothetical protein
MVCLILMRASEPSVIDIELLLKMDHYKIGICQLRPFPVLNLPSDVNKR